MAAPLGFKTFNTGDVLSAADTNGYLMQGVLVFADAAARTAAITSPQEGQTSYLKDTDVIRVYSGAAWVTKSGGSSPLTTKGDLYTYSTTDARLAVGTNGHTLVANSATATGLEWQAPAGGGGMTVIQSGNLTGSSISISTISGYKNLQLVLRDSYTSTALTGTGIRVNALNTNEYNYIVQASYGITSQTGANSFALTNASNYESNTDGDQACIFNFFDVENTTAKKLVTYHYIFKDDTSTFRLVQQFGWLNATAAITTVKIETTAGNFGGGTYILYGVK